MTASVVIELLLAALGIAINPPAVIAAILLVSSSRRKALAFAFGWVVGLLVVGSVVMLAGEAVEQTGEASVWTLAAKTLVGVTLLGLAVAKWRSHRTATGDKELPGWMRRLYEISAPRAFLAAAAYAALNPKTIAFVATGVLVILGAPLGLEAEWMMLVLFVAASSLSVTAPVTYAVLAPSRAREVLATAERWLGDNSSLVGAAVLLVLGVMVTYSGVVGLAEITR